MPLAETAVICDKDATCQALQRLLGEERDMCDFTFLVGEEKEPVSAVRAVVAVQSKPLKAMLFDDKFKQCDKELELPQWRPAAFRMMLEFLHGGAVEADAAVAVELMELADYFQVDELKNRCRCFLAENLSVDTATMLLSEAPRLNDEKLREECKQLFLSSAGTALQTDAIAKLPEEVLCELLSDDGLNADEWQVFQAVKVWAESRRDLHRAAARPLQAVRFALLNGEQLREVRTQGLVDEAQLLDATLDKLDGKQEYRQRGLCFTFGFDSKVKGDNVLISDNKQSATFSTDKCVLGNQPLPARCQAYWEVLVASGSNAYIGIARRERINVNQNMGAGGGIAWRVIGGLPDVWNEGASQQFSPSAAVKMSPGDRVGVLVDLPAGSLRFFVNGQSSGVALSNLDQAREYWPCISNSQGEMHLVQAPRFPVL